MSPLKSGPRVESETLVNVAVLMFKGMLTKKVQGGFLLTFPTLHHATSWAEFSPELTGYVRLWMGVDGQVDFDEPVVIRFGATAYDVARAKSTFKYLPPTSGWETPT